MQFSSREQEIRAHRMLSTFNNPPQPDQMTYEQPSKGNFWL